MNTSLAGCWLGCSFKSWLWIAAIGLTAGYGLRERQQRLQIESEIAAKREAEEISSKVDQLFREFLRKVDSSVYPFQERHQGPEIDAEIVAEGDADETSGKAD